MTESPAASENAPTPAPAGVLNLYKPTGKSSANYVYRLRRTFGLWKVGHAGTLDPFADGVLLACVGKGTKWVERLMGLPKRYLTTLRLGVTNETFDTEREFTEVPGARPVALAEIEAVISPMIGEVPQIPPAFSAMRIGGVSSYKLAKRGKAVAMQPRLVRIDSIRILAYEWPSLGLEIVCGRGTYIRAIARDLGAALGCGACCEQLSRLAVGPFRMEDSARLDGCDDATIRARLHSLDAVAEMLGHGV